MNCARDFPGTSTLNTIFANCEKIQKQLATDESFDVINKVEELFEQMKEVWRGLNNVKANAHHEEIYAVLVNYLLERLLKTCREFENVVKANADRLINIRGGADQLLEKCKKIVRKVENAFKRIDYKIYKGRSPSIYEKYKGKIEEYKSPKSVLEKPNSPQVRKFRENKTNEYKIESVIAKSEEISPKISLSSRKIRKIVKLRQKLMKRRKNWSLTIPTVAIGAVALILFLV